MSETRRLLEAANALSQLLRSKNISHAFYGSVLIAVLGSFPQSDEIFCIVEGGHSQTHPFRRVRDAVAGHEDFSTTLSPWTNRLHVTYRRLIPSIEVSRDYTHHMREILPAGETGPRRLDTNTVMKIQGTPFLTISEFIRAKLKSWIISRLDHDAQDITFLMTRYWNRIDINRIQETDMLEFVARIPIAAPAWNAVVKKYNT